jgi:hypothetical protein
MGRLLSLIACLTVAGAASAAPAAPLADSRLAKAEALVDAFYKFDRAGLRAAMANAPGSQGDTLYYQLWAEAGHYAVLHRQPCQLGKAGEVACPVTVKDDLIPALGLDIHVTDVFHIRFEDGRAVEVWNTSDDPPEYQQAMAWLKRDRPEIFTGPCRGMWAGGPMPQDCVRAIVKGFADFTAGQ